MKRCQKIPTEKKLEQDFMTERQGKLQIFRFSSLIFFSENEFQFPYINQISSGLTIPWGQLVGKKLPFFDALGPLGNSNAALINYRKQW